MDLFFKLVAPFYDRAIGRRNTLALARQIKSLAGDALAGRVLDVGGGTGRIAAELRSNGGRVVVLDASRPMLAQARRKDGLTLVQGSATALPFLDGAFDLVVCVDALHHLPEPERVVEEVARVLRPGGRLFIQDYDVSRLAVKLVAFGERLMRSRGRFYRPDDLVRLLASASLALVAETRDGVAYTVLTEKKVA